MADENKVYEPIEITPTPFPQANENTFSESSGKSGDVYNQSETKPQEFPVKRVAREVISQALNTKSRKILAEFQFTKSGAIQIGEFENGISGDVRITPNGITARDSAGETTFDLDAESGDAIFKGQVRVGSFIGADDVVIERSSNGGARIVLYNNGIPQIVIGDPS